MKLEDIKVGETYNVRVTVKYIDGYEVVTATIGQDGKEGYRTRFLLGDIPAFSPISPESGEKNTDPAQKFDPCRPFKKGDRVEPTFWNDRPPVASELRANSEFLPHDGIYTVLSDERNSIAFIDYHGKSVFIPVNHLKLVIPVEELEPYFVGESENSYDLFRKTSNGNQLRASFWWKHNPTPDLIELSKANAKAAAEAECDRLNAEYRKEKK